MEIDIWLVRILTFTHICMFHKDKLPPYWYHAACQDLAQAVEGAKPEREYRILHERKKLVEQAEELRELFYKIDLDTWPTWPTWPLGYPLGRLVGCPACGEGLYPMVWIRLTILHCLGRWESQGFTSSDQDHSRSILYWCESIHKRKCHNDFDYAGDLISIRINKLVPQSTNTF